MSFVFWDTETTGTSPAFDQILQFAAIRTDADLNELARFEVRSRLLPYVVPSPGAMRVTGLTIDDLFDERHPSHYEMVSQIRAALGPWCPAAFVAHNGLRFDEEMLRQAFYQCLYPPYLTNTGGSRRADTLHLFRAAALLHPGALTIPANDKGRPSFKLDRLAPANGFTNFNAHDALADVEALIFLCRIVREGCPELWARWLRFASKPVVEDFLRKQEAFHVLEFFPTSTGSFICTAIGSSAGTVAYAYDLATDPDELRALTDDELAERLGRTPRPLRKVRKNAAPSLCPLEEAPEQFLGGVSPEEWRRRARALRSDRALVERLVRAAASAETTYEPSPHVEQQIYEGFWSDADARRLDRFHRVGWEERVGVAADLTDPRLQWLARRLIFVERPELLLPDQRAAMAAEKARRMLAGEGEVGGWTTLAAATAELDGMLAEVEGASAPPWLRLRAYLSELQARAAELIGARTEAVRAARV